MRKVIGGRAYDTETAELVASGSHDHEMSQAWWSLYRTSAGAWFEVAADHEGIVEEFAARTEGEARRWLERHASHLVGKYFGTAPEASASDYKNLRFSRRTVIAAAGVQKETFSQSGLTEFLLELGPDFPRQVSGDSSSRAKRLNELLVMYDEAPDRLVEG